MSESPDESKKPDAENQPENSGPESSESENGASEEVTEPLALSQEPPEPEPEPQPELKTSPEQAGGNRGLGPMSRWVAVGAAVCAAFFGGLFISKAFESQDSEASGASFNRDLESDEDFDHEDLEEGPRGPSQWDDDRHESDRPDYEDRPDYDDQPGYEDRPDYDDRYEMDERGSHSGPPPLRSGQS